MHQCKVSGLQSVLIGRLFHCSRTKHTVHSNLSFPAQQVKDHVCFIVYLLYSSELHQLDSKRSYLKNCLTYFKLSHHRIPVSSHHTMFIIIIIIGGEVVSYAEVDHWMWRLFLDDYGSVCDHLGLSSTTPLSDVSLPPPTTLLYGISSILSPRQPYWPKRCASIKRNCTFI